MLSALPPELERHLQAQERFETIRQAWSRGPARHGADLAYANPYAGPPPAVREILRQAVAAERSLNLQYTPYGGATIPRRRVAEKLRQQHGLPFQWQDVVLTPGAMAALNLLLRTLVDDGPRRLILPTPCWLDYPLYAQQLGLACEMVPMRREDHRLDLDAIAAALATDSSGLLLTQPGNPSGLAATAAELEQLGGLLAEAEARHGHPILLISDECHRDFVPDAEACPSAARFHPTSAIVYSFGKRLFIQGQRIGFAAVAPSMPQREAYRQTLTRLCRAMGFCTPTALMQRALIDLMELPLELDWLMARREAVSSALRQAGYRLPAGDGTFFLYPEIPNGEEDFHFTERLAQAGVLVLPAPIFHHRGHVRLSLTDTDEALERALPILCEAIRP